MDPPPAGYLIVDDEEDEYKVKDCLEQCDCGVFILELLGHFNRKGLLNVTVYEFKQRCWSFH